MAAKSLRRKLIFIFFALGSVLFLLLGDRKQFFLQATSPRYNNPGQGLFVCHGTANMGKDYVKGGGVIVLWGKLQPESNYKIDEKGWSNLKAQIMEATKGDKKVYLHFMVYPGGGNERDFIWPVWIKQDKNITWLPSNYGLFPAPWDETYQRKLENFLNLLGKRLPGEGFKGRVEYIEPAVGGAWGSTSLWIGNNHFEKWVQEGSRFGKNKGLCSSQENSYRCFGRVYSQAVNQIVSLYNKAFPSFPMMIIGGSAPKGEASYQGFNDLLSRYGMKVMYKAAGLGARSSDCGLRVAILSGLCSGSTNPPKTKCGQEPWGPSIYSGGNGFDDQTFPNCGYETVYSTSLLQERVSYYCVYSRDLGNSRLEKIHRNLADNLGAQIEVVSKEVQTPVNPGESFPLTVSWRNKGAAPLVSYSVQGEKWVPASYNLFLEWEKEGFVIAYRELPLSPPTYQWPFADKSSVITTKLEVKTPEVQEGRYRLFLGLVSPNQRKERFALINSWGNDLTNRRYLATDAFFVGKKVTGSLPVACQGNEKRQREKGDFNYDFQTDLLDLQWLVNCLWKNDGYEPACRYLSCQKDKNTFFTWKENFNF
ncbi:hypothetical protein J7J95_02015 [bacterium]|nr:hypothetical protein [bacterium]